MKVILLKDVKGVGRRFEEKDVSDGYANNFLLPKKLAVSASAASANQVRSQKLGEEQARNTEKESLLRRVNELKGITITIKAKADEKNHLFEKITRDKVAKAAEIDPDLVLLDTPIRELGTYNIELEIEKDKKTSFTLEVVRAEPSS